MLDKNLLLGAIAVGLVLLWRQRASGQEADERRAPHVFEPQPWVGPPLNQEEQGARPRPPSLPKAQLLHYAAIRQKRLSDQAAPGTPIGPGPRTGPATLEGVYGV